jgi:hypothetical protein
LTTPTLASLLHHFTLTSLLLQETVIPTGQYPDSGATHHVTFDLQNLNIRSEDYTRSDQIHMGNGNGLSIHHISDTLFSSPNASFLLHNVLHVPSITKNLHFVHRFTLETKTDIEFILPIFLFFIFFVKK